VERPPPRPGMRLKMTSLFGSFHKGILYLQEKYCGNKSKQKV
jgi:hypothetical protein